MNGSKLNRFGFPVCVEEFTQEDINWLKEYLTIENFKLSDFYNQNQLIGYYARHDLISANKKMLVTGQILPLFVMKRIDPQYFYTKLNNLMQWLGDYEILKRQNQEK